MTDMVKQLDNIKPGQILVYYTGKLANSGGISDVRNAAYKVHMEDRGYLVQKRIGDIFQYIAIGKRAIPNPKQVNQRIFYIQTLESKA